MIISGLSNLANANKGVYWTIQSFILVPLGMMTWVEAMACDSFLIYFGGHLWYDLSIPIAVIAYFFCVKQAELAKP